MRVERLILLICHLGQKRNNKWRKENRKTKSNDFMEMCDHRLNSRFVIDFPSAAPTNGSIGTKHMTWLMLSRTIFKQTIAKIIAFMFYILHFDYIIDYIELPVRNSSEIKLISIPLYRKLFVKVNSSPWAIFMSRRVVENNIFIDRCVCV